MPEDFRFRRTVLSGLLGLCAGLPDGRRQIIALLAPGEVVCACAVSRLDCWVEALSSSVLCEARAVVASDEPGGYWFERVMTQVVVLGRLDGKERVAWFLIDMCRRLGRFENDEWLLAIPMSREDIADHLGLNPDSLTRILRKFRHDRLLTGSSVQDLRIPTLGGFHALVPGLGERGEGLGSSSR